MLENPPSSIAPCSALSWVTISKVLSIKIMVTFLWLDC
jgi:hypothetical protein